MKIQYLGTGASEGIPALFCHCEYCNAVRSGKGRIRSRAQVIADGELSIEFPPDAFYHQACGADLSAVKYLLVTHSHMDHFSAHNFIMRGGRYAVNMTAPRLDIFANKEVLKVFREDVRREMRDDIRDTIGLHRVRAFEKFTFGAWTAYALKAKHTSKEPFVFLLEKDGKRILHLTDTGPLPEEDYAFLGKLGGTALDLCTIDCTFFYGPMSVNARHMSLKENGETFRRLEEIGFLDGHTKKVITHFSHNGAPTDETLSRAEREYGVIAAYDGLEIEI